MFQQEPEASPDFLPGMRTPDFLGLLQIAWRRKSLILLAVAASLVAGALYYVQRTPIYKSEAQVLVVKKRPDAVTNDSRGISHFEDYINTHRILIESPLIVKRAIDRANLSKLKTFADETEDLVEVIIDDLTVGRVSKELSGNSNSILKLEFRGKVASECGIVVNAVVDSYKTFLDETYRNMSDDTVKLIKEARDVLDNDLTRKEAAYREFREKSPMIWKGKEEVNPRQDRLAMIEMQRTTLLLKRADLEEQLTTINRAQESGREDEELVALVSDLATRSSEVSGRPDAQNDRLAATSLKNQLLPLLQEEQTLLQDLGPNHPQVKAVRQKIDATRNFFALPSAAYSKAVESASRQGRKVSFVDLYVQYLKQELERVKTSEQARSELFRTEHEAARELNSYESRDSEFRADITRTQSLYDGLVKRLQEASLVKDYGGFDARIIAPAGIGKKVVPNGLITFGLAAFVGLFAGMGLVYLAETTDNSFRTPEEIRRALGLSVFGHIPRFEADQAARSRAAANGGLDPMLFTFHQPRSVEAEAFRAIRTSLYFSSAGEGHKVIQVTSPNPGDGKSTVAANIAASIAQSGKSVLLIDADLRKPRQHRIFTVTARTGLASVIADDVDATDAIQPTRVRNLSILPCGPLPDDPSELLTSPRFPELLGLLREKYDYVLVDTPPLLVVTDPGVVASQTDGVLLTVRINKDGRSQAQRAKDILDTLDAKILGVVVNGVDSKSGGYEYAHYSYAAAEGYLDHNRDSAADLGDDDVPPTREVAANGRRA